MVHNEAGGVEITSSINVSSDCMNRIGCSRQIYEFQMVLHEMSYIQMNFRQTYCSHQLRTTASGEGASQNGNMTPYAVQVVITPKLSIWVQFD